MPAGREEQMGKYAVSARAVPWVYAGEMQVQVQVHMKGVLHLEHPIRTPAEVLAEETGQDVPLARDVVAGRCRSAPVSVVLPEALLFSRGA